MPPLSCEQWHGITGAVMLCGGWTRRAGGSRGGSVGPVVYVLGRMMTVAKVPAQ